MRGINKHIDTHFLSVDLEDWYSSAYLRDYVKLGELIPRIEQSTKLILELFEKKKLKATFFVLGSIAEKHPELIKEIARKGHEIASHGFSHTPLWDLNEETFEEEIVQTNKILFALTGKKIKGFRAPYASLDASTAWALDVLEKHGFEYDSSIFPMRTILYGVANAPTEIYQISSSNIFQNNPQAKLTEIPFSIFNSALLKIPCTGGIYGRFLPKFILQKLLKRIAKERALNFYFHPWEIDKEIPRIKVPLFNKIVSYYNCSSYLSKLDKLLDEFNFTSFEEKLKERL